MSYSNGDDDNGDAELTSDVRVAVKDVRARRARQIQFAKKSVAIFAILNILAAGAAALISLSPASPGERQPSFVEVFSFMWFTVYGGMLILFLFIGVIVAIAMWAWPEIGK